MYQGTRYHLVCNININSSITAVVLADYNTPCTYHVKIAWNSSGAVGRSLAGPFGRHSLRRFSLAINHDSEVLERFAGTSINSYAHLSGIALTRLSGSLNYSLHAGAFETIIFLSACCELHNRTLRCGIVLHGCTICSQLSPREGPSVHTYTHAFVR